MFQIALFDLSEIQIVPKHGKVYSECDQPSHLLTAEDWGANGFIIRAGSSPQAYLYDKEKERHIELYSARYLDPKDPDPLLHVAALDEMIMGMTAKIDAQQAVINKHRANRDKTLFWKSGTDNPDDIAYYQEALSVFVGLYIQAVDDMKKLKSELKKLQESR